MCWTSSREELHYWLTLHYFSFVSSREQSSSLRWTETKESFNLDTVRCWEVLHLFLLLNREWYCPCGFDAINIFATLINNIQLVLALKSNTFLWYYLPHHNLFVMKAFAESDKLNQNVSFLFNNSTIHPMISSLDSLLSLSHTHLLIII